MWPPKAEAEEMGKATIQGSLGEGQYNILYHRNIAKIQARIAKIQAEVQTLTTVDLPVYTAALEQAEASLASLIEALNAAILVGDEKEMQRATSYAQTARVQAESAKSALDNLKLKITSLEGEIAFLQKSMPVDEEIQVWCADLNITLSGVVGTIEVPGEAEKILIKPGGMAETQAEFNQATDGFVTPALALSPEECFYNQALLPGWQKWQPTYRIGTITALDGNTCDVNLDAAASSQQSLDVNKQDVWGDVPIEYLSCNGGAFRVGDRVVVKFTGTGPGSDYIPKVIGFEMNPKACEWRFKVTRDDGLLITPDVITATLGNSFSIDVMDSFQTYVYGGWLYSNGIYSIWGPSGGSFSFDTETDEWVLKVPSGYIPASENTGFWVLLDTSYQMNTLMTQYPFVYKYAQMNNPDHLIQPEKYIDHLPYWKIADEWWLPNYSQATSTGKTVYSSVPYRVQYNIGVYKRRYILLDMSDIDVVPHKYASWNMTVTITGGIVTNITGRILAEGEDHSEIIGTDMLGANLGGAALTLAWATTDTAPPTGYMWWDPVIEAGGSISPDPEYG